jgi:transcriptional regulator with XRE-family HTH domain
MRWEAIVGRNVRSLRKARGLTQEALAHVAEIDTRYVGGIERGEENPTVAVLARIASVLGIEPGDFFAKPALHPEAAIKATQPPGKRRRSRPRQRQKNARRQA